MKNKKIVVIENHALATTTIRHDLMRAIQNQGIDLYVLTGYNSDFNKLIKSGINMVDIGSSVSNPLCILKYLKILRKTLKNINPDICLTFTIRPAIYGNLITNKLNIPTISNITGIGPLFENNNLSYKIARFLYPIALRKTIKVFFQNHDDLEIFVNKGFVQKKNSSRIPGSGVNLDYYSPRTNNLTDQGSFTFLFISRLVKDKGIFEYIEAARIVKEKYNNVEFQIIGPLWEQNLKELTISKNMLDQWIAEKIINYIGEVGDVRNNIAAADCIVLPSYREGISNVLLEASSMEKPLIATNVTGCKEVLDDGITGLLCNVKDSVHLAQCMDKMINMSKSDRIEMGKKGRKKMAKEYDKKYVIDTYLSAITKILIENNKFINGK